MSFALGWLRWALLSALFAALTAILAKLGLEDADADAATWVRTTVILACISLLVSISGKWNAVLQLTQRQWVFLTLSGLAAAASWICYFRALQIGTATQVSVVDRGSLAVVALLSILLLAERPQPREWIGIALVILGAGLVASVR
mgnify:CR=1 FL=1